VNSYSDSPKEYDSTGNYELIKAQLNDIQSLKSSLESVSTTALVIILILSVLSGT
jgi:hypothetical protein